MVRGEQTSKVPLLSTHVSLCVMCGAQVSGEPMHSCYTLVTKLVCFVEGSSTDNSNLVEPTTQVKAKNLCLIVALGKMGYWAELSV